MPQSPLLSREPVVNHRRSITANRLIVHADSTTEAVAALSALSEVWPTQHTVFVSLADLIPDEQLLRWRTPENTMLEIPVESLTTHQTAHLVSEMMAGGIAPCLRGCPDAHANAIADHWRFVLMRANHKPTGASGIPLAYGLSDLEAFDNAVEAGFAGASGWFFLHVQPASNATLRPGHAQIIHLLNRVRNNADVREIENILKRDVNISYRLLRYINSPAFGLRCEIQSFGHAVSILGYESLKKWLSLLLLEASDTPDAPALIQTSIARGHFMESVGSSYLPAEERANLFITGAFSILPVLLGIPMQSLLEEMHLPAGISRALLEDTGDLAPFLQLARLTEGTDAEALTRHAETLQLDGATLNTALLRAVAFADSLAAQ